MAGFAAGPKVHLVDGYALTDPLLARIFKLNTGRCDRLLAKGCRG